jgi:hypothetical protein
MHLEILCTPFIRPVTRELEKLPLVLELYSENNDLFDIAANVDHGSNV